MMKYLPMDMINKKEVVFGISTLKGEGPWKELSEEGMRAYSALGELLHADPKRMVRPEQRHTDVILKVDESMGGMGVIRDVPEPPADGLITDIPGMTLCILTADCVPVALADPVRRAIGMVHSGWKGTKACISLRALEMMGKEYGTDPKDVIVWVGPHICRECYEVGEELIPQFRETFSGEVTSFFRPKENGKYLLDMGLAIQISLMRGGVPKKNIRLSDRCTYEDGTLNSYRRDGADAGRNLSAIVLREYSV